MWKFARRFQLVDLFALCSVTFVWFPAPFSRSVSNAFSEPVTFLLSTGDGLTPGFLPSLTSSVVVMVGMLLSDRFDWLKPYRPVHFLNRDAEKRIEERKQNDQQLDFQFLLSQVDDAVIAVDQEERIIYWNGGAAKLYGLSGDAALGRSLTEAVQYQWLHPGDRQRADEALATQGHWRGENLHINAQGEQIFVESSVAVLKDRVGNAIGRIGVLRDINERKQIEAQLQESQSQLAAVLESVQDVLWSRDIRTRRLLYTTPSVEQIYGVPMQEVLQQPNLWLDCVHPEDRPRLLEIDRALFEQQSDDRFDIEYRLCRPDGALRWVRDRRYVVRNQQGQLDRVNGITTDITASKQIAAEIERLNQELEQRVLERTAQLQIAQADLESLNDDLERRVIQRTIELELTNRLLEQEVADRKLSEARYRSLALASAEAVWTMEATGEVTTAQPSWERLTGQRYPDYLDTGWIAMVHPDDQSRVMKQWNETVITRSTYHSEHRVRAADGRYRYFSVRTVPVFDESGNLLEWVGVHTDISEAKQAEQALRTSEQRFRRLAESNIFGVAFGNFAGTIVDANDYFLRMIGYDRSDLESGRLRWIDITPTEYLPLDWNAGNELRQRGVSTPFEKEYIRKDGSRVPILIGSALMNEPYDEQTEVVSFYVDLTDRKRAEAEREKLLAQEQAARLQAETANRIKDEFLAVLSHELRSPLNPILGWTKLLRTRSFDAATTDRALETIERNAKLQTQLIEDLLDVSRILRGKMSLQMTAVNLVSVIEAAIETVQLPADAKAIRVEFLSLPAAYQVVGDSARLQQIFWNLLSNAIKFTPNGGRVSVKLERVEGEIGAMRSRGAEEPGSRGAKEQGSRGAREQGGRGQEQYLPPHPLTHPPTPSPPPSPTYAQITITDTGKGIHPDFLDHVFDYFRQADSSITRSFGGLGLGLAIVRHLVELHGGRVSAASEGEGKGATFTVYLPLIEASVPLSVEPVPDPGLPKAELLRGVRVLAVDDEADMREYVSTLLQEAGATVMLASSAKETLTILLKTVPDILITDIGMPQIDGYTLLKQIRQLSAKQGGQLPAIALTAYAGEYDQQQAKAAGFQLHLSKPIEPDHLVQAIRQLLDAKQFS
jgi:PAS domain S-box-containing protein